MLVFLRNYSCPAKKKQPHQSLPLKLIKSKTLFRNFYEQSIPQDFIDLSEK